MESLAFLSEARERFPENKETNKNYPGANADGKSPAMIAKDIHGFPLDMTHVMALSRIIKDATVKLLPDGAVLIRTTEEVVQHWTRDEGTTLNDYVTFSRMKDASSSVAGPRAAGGQ